MHHPKSFDPLEKYVARRCHLGTNNNFVEVSTPIALRRTPLLNGKGMLWTYPNLVTLGT
jgi:hypothetical protein